MSEQNLNTERTNIYKIEVVFNKKIMELICELLTQLNELADLIPDWQHLEAKQTCDKISQIMGEMLETQRLSQKHL